MRSLLWKEWHEQSWKLAFGCLVLVSFAIIGLHSRIIADEKMMMWVCFMGVGLLPVLSSTGLIPAERADGSFESLLAIPVASWRILLAKTLVGMLQCGGPLLAAGLVSLLMVGGRELSGETIVNLYCRSTLASLSLFVWMVALTSRLPSEARAGLVALGVLILWSLVSIGLTAPGVPRALLAISPFTFFYVIFTSVTDTPGFFMVFIAQLAILSAVWTVTVRVFNRS
jgi:ABC-type transport system involved in multi-copper enzyme maturation permease subunit